MTTLVDAGPLVATADPTSAHGRRVQALLKDASDLLIMSAQVTAEVDYLVGARFGERPRRRFLNDLAGGAFRVECLKPGDYDTVRALDEQYADLRPGLSDLSLVVLAARFDTRRILTFDQRHFRVMRPLQGGSFEILPADLP
ncbi:MAG: type II toxin-antitoxin system VapC family toxin [Egibacteraceae bacterium]